MSFSVYALFQLFSCCFQFFCDQLSVDQSLVYSIQGNKVVVASSLHNLSRFHHNDFVSVPDCAKSMSNQDNCLFARLDQLVECLLNLVLTLSI